MVAQTMLASPDMASLHYSPNVIDHEWYEIVANLPSANTKGAQKEQMDPWW